MDKRGWYVLRTAIKLAGTIAFIVEGNYSISRQNAELTLQQAYEELEVIKKFLDSCSVAPE